MSQYSLNAKATCDTRYRSNLVTVFASLTNLGPVGPKAVKHYAVFVRGNHFDSLLSYAVQQRGTFFI